MVYGKELALTTARPEDEDLIKIQIADKKKQMRPFEEEYWQLLVNESASIPVSDPVSEIVVAEIVETVEKLQTSQQYPVEVMEWLQKIYAEVSKPGSPAEAKLKGTLSLMPPFVNVSYEAELDTEKFLRTNFPTFSKWAKALAAKKSYPAKSRSFH
jgi:hypothetical protein